MEKYVIAKIALSNYIHTNHKNSIILCFLMLKYQSWLIPPNFT